MTNDELNRKLAEAIETEPSVGWAKAPGGGYISDLGCWWTDFGEPTRPRDFCTDGTAMLSLMTAAQAHDIHIAMGARFVAAETMSADAITDSYDRPAVNADLPRVVAEIVAEALGIEMQ